MAAPLGLYHWRSGHFLGITFVASAGKASDQPIPGQRSALALPTRHHMQLRLPLIAAFAFGLSSAASAQALDQVTFATNWLPEAEHGGFYQALADGTYEAYGLDVTIIPGGPNVNNRARLIARQVQFYMSGNLLQPINAMTQDIPPIIQVAAMFQKEPQVFIAHPDAGIETFSDLAKLPTIFMSTDIYVSVFAWMKSVWPEFNDSQRQPYAFTVAPFLADPLSAQQGYVTSEPFSIEQVGGFEPKVFLIADYGFDTPSTMIEARADYVEANPDIVQRFVNASIIGWYNYLYGDNTAGNDLIKRENPQMTDELINFAVEQLRERGIVDSGVALENGIGCFDDARVRSFYDAMVTAGVAPAGLDMSTIYTNRFVCNGVGMVLKARAAE
jgi:NitT/TauT family transport system substrate-binding protein